MTEYVITDPMIITSELTPGVIIPAESGGADMVLSVQAYRILDGRVQWRTHIYTLGGAIIYADRGGLHTGPQYGADGNGAREALATLCSFLAAEAERYLGTMGAEPSDGDGWIFNPAVAEWAYIHSDAIAMMAEELR